MSSSNAHVSWMLELTVKESRNADLRALMAEMVRGTQEEAGTLDYEWYLSDDGRRLHLFERYANSDAALVHMAIFGERYMARFFDILVPDRIVLYGAPNAAVQGAFAQFSPSVLAQASGFSRRGPMMVRESSGDTSLTSRSADAPTPA